MTNSNRVNRRRFLQKTASTAGSLFAAPLFLNATVLGRAGMAAPSDRVAMGFIGLGTMGWGHLVGEAWTYLPGGYVARPDVEVLALCDVWRDKRESVLQKINAKIGEKMGKPDYNGCKAYADFREVLDRDDIDAVLIATPIHWHATHTVLAAQAGKDVYCEKPTAVTVKESQAMAKACRDNKRIFQAGTQQRSEYEGKFHRACELIRNGAVGKLESVYCHREGGGAIWPKEHGPEQPVPEGFDWDLWLGPAPMMPFQGRADAHLFGYGGINWGQHHYDIVNWALDADRTGPVELFVDNGMAAYRFASGVTVYGRAYPGQTIGETGGGWFIGTEGKIGLDREHLVAEPAGILEKEIPENGVHLYKSSSHSGNFLECVKTRKPAICDHETAHHAATIMLIGGIVQQLGRPLKWDPKKEQFEGDDEANALLDLPKREPWVV